MRIGIDAGGTFTDFVVAHDDGRIDTFKIRSDPDNPAVVILEGLRRAGGRTRDEIVHGSTVATNALLERKGVRTALVTTAGFEDVIQIGRQNRAQLYVLSPGPKKTLANPALCFGVNERTYFDGTIAAAPAKLDQLSRKLRGANVEAIAICLLHSYANPENERIIRDAVATAAPYVCCSHEICPEFREYERSTTTFLNAYVGPLMDRYLSQLETAPKLWIMQSNGGVIRAREAREHAVRTLLSGPAGGVVGAIETARLSGYTKVLGFDMGGTSTDVSLSEGTPRQTAEAYIDGIPVRVPMLDIQTVGAGGGSIARVDEGGLLRVGPQSAGSVPGPACYGEGDRPTVTDAHVVLGRIRDSQFLGGSMPIYPERAAAAIDKIARALGATRKAAAEGIIRVANANMERAIRSVSVERGYDPREFALVAFGGCGGLHACEIANELGIRTVILPEHAGVLSALGMLMADRVRDYTAGVVGRTWRFKELESRARKDMPGCTIERYLDMRYAGQSYELTVPEGASFHAAHQKMYGYSDESRSTEVIAIRIRALSRVSKPSLRSTQKQKPVKGPALIADYGATTWIPAGWVCRGDRHGNRILTM
ncbi:MAG TPA: hydantoinase/oxoprolinase family protein [Bryobacteraceae bacterium]|nr:hydantoinase/oxoprolinase family protein [Bryobacteraceae bacterium]